MSIFVVDTRHDITQLFRQITDNIRNAKTNAECVLDDYITVSANKENLNPVKSAIAQSASNFIIGSIENDKLRNIISEYKLDKSDAKIIIENIKKDENLTMKRKNILNYALLNYLKCSSTLNVDGLVDFRLDEYKIELSHAVKIHVDEFVTKKAYDEFLSLLKYFVNVQDSHIPFINITGDEISGYMLTDEFGIPVENYFEDDFTAELSITDLQNDDILISRLIAISPQKITMECCDESRPIISTLKKIFENRIVFSK